MKYYVLKIDGDYIVDIDPQLDKPTLGICATNNINKAKLLDDEARKSTTMGLATLLDTESVKIEGLAVERDTHVATDDETPTGYVIRFESRGVYLTNLLPDSVKTTKVDLEEEALNHAKMLNKKETAEKMAEMFRLQGDLDFLADELQGQITVLPVVRDTKVLETI